MIDGPVVPQCAAPLGSILNYNKLTVSFNSQTTTLSRAISLLRGEINGKEEVWLVGFHGERLNSGGESGGDPAEVLRESLHNTTCHHFCLAGAPQCWQCCLDEVLMLCRSDNVKPFSYIWEVFPNYYQFFYCHIWHLHHSVAKSANIFTHRSNVIHV